MQVEAASRLEAAPEQVWQQVTTPAGIADELRPWLRMTMPARLRGGTLATVPVGEPLGRAWLLLGGVLPVEHDDLELEVVEPGRFVEQSRLLSARSWRHERRVDPAGAGCLLTDRLTLVPRRLVPAALAERVVRRLFEHRHRRLRHRYGGERCPG